MKKKANILGTAMVLSALTAFPVLAGDVKGCNGVLGDGVIIDEKFPQIVSLIIKVIQIVVPVLLVIFGMLDLVKAMIASKEDEIKKGQKVFISRLIAAAIVFFVIAVVRLLFSFLSSGEEDEKESMLKCFNCFLNGPESEECEVQ